MGEAGVVLFILGYFPGGFFGEGERGAQNTN